MADLDTIVVCEKCLHPVERLILCPDCKVEVKKMPSLLLTILRILKAKGWIIDEWYEGKSQAYFTVGLKFFSFAPPPSQWVLPEIRDLVPWVVSRTDTAPIKAFRQLYDWAVQAPHFVVPFAQDFCDLCKQQGADWYYSRVNCPVSKQEVKGVPRPIIFVTPNTFRTFADGYPEQCAYAVEQVVTFTNRLTQLEKYFDKSVFARRRCMRQVVREA